MADGPTRLLLADAQLLGRHSLEMPFEYEQAEHHRAWARLPGLVRASRAF